MTGERFLATLFAISGLVGDLDGRLLGGSPAGLLSGQSISGLVLPGKF